MPNYDLNDFVLVENEWLEADDLHHPTVSDNHEIIYRTGTNTMLTIREGSVYNQKTQAWEDKTGAYVKYFDKEFILPYEIKDAYRVSTYHEMVMMYDYVLSKLARMPKAARQKSRYYALKKALEEEFKSLIENKQKTEDKQKETKKTEAKNYLKQREYDTLVTYEKTKAEISRVLFPMKKKPKRVIDMWLVDTPLSQEQKNQSYIALVKDLVSKKLVSNSVFTKLTFDEKNLAKMLTKELEKTLKYNYVKERREERHEQKANIKLAKVRSDKHFMGDNQNKQFRER